MSTDQISRAPHKYSPIGMIGNQPGPNSYAVKSDFRLWNDQKAWRWRWHSATLLSKVERLRLADLVMVACSMPFQKCGFGSQEIARCNADLMSQLGIICGKLIVPPRSSWWNHQGRFERVLKL